MKKLLIISIAICIGIMLVGQSACKPKKNRLPIPAAPFVKMTFNGTPWVPDSFNNFHPYPMTNDGNRFSITTFNGINNINGFSYADYNFYFSYFYKQLGKQRISSKRFFDIIDSIMITDTLNNSYCTLATFQQDGEFLCEEYQVLNDDPNNNWLEIIQEEDNYKRIWGKFNLKMYRAIVDNGCTIVRFADTISIKDGSFYLELP